jgi:hypothetical protein
MSGPARSAGLAAIGLVGVAESNGRFRLHKAPCGGRTLRKEAPACRNDRAAHERLPAQFHLKINDLALSAERARQIGSRKAAESGPRTQ